MAATPLAGPVRDHGFTVAHHDPSNGDIAAALDELGDLYELDGAIAHRVLAYRTAAKTIRETPGSVAALARAGRAIELSGVGATLAEKILALIETGTIPAAEKLRATYPEGVVAMTRIPGLGPKRAKRLFEELGIDSLAALREAAQAERIRDLKGFGEKAEATIIAALDAGHGAAPRQRMTLGSALAVGEQIADALRVCPAVVRAEVAGSARRGADSVKARGRPCAITSRPSSRKSSIANRKSITFRLQ